MWIEDYSSTFVRTAWQDILQCEPVLIQWLADLHQTWWDDLHHQEDIRFFLALSRILISLDIWICFQIGIEILDNFGFVLKTRCWNRSCGFVFHMHTPTILLLFLSLLLLLLLLLLLSGEWWWLAPGNSREGNSESNSADMWDTSCSASWPSTWRLSGLSQLVMILSLMVYRWVTHNLYTVPPLMTGIQYFWDTI